MGIYEILIIVHVIGTVIGVGGATMIEVTLNKSLKDGHISDDESEILKPTYLVVRVGLVLAILSGFGFLLLYKFLGATAELYNPVLWAKIIVILMILVNTLLLQAHKVSLYWGSALSFTSWWTAAILGVFLSNQISYSLVEILVFYVVLVVVSAYILHIIRQRLNK